LLFLKGGVKNEYMSGKSIERFFWYLFGTIIAATIGLFAIFDTLITIILRFSAYYNLRHSLIYGIICENSILVSLSLASFVVAGIFSLFGGPAKLSAIFKDSIVETHLNFHVKMALYFLKEFPLILLGFALSTLALLACRALVLTLNYRMHKAHFSKRIEENRASFAVIKLFKGALGKRICDCDEDALKIVEIIGERTGIKPEAAIFVQGSCNSCTADKPSVLLEALKAFYGKSNAELIFSLVKPHRHGLITAEEIANFVRYTFDETDKISDGLMEQDNILTKLSGFMTAFQGALVVVVFLTCLGHGSWVREYGLLTASGVLGAGYVFSSILAETFKSLVFVLIVRPYSVGDPVIVDNRILVVTDIGIFRTSFLEGSISCTIPNLYLVDSKISNLRLSESYEVLFPLRLNSKCFFENKSVFIERLNALTESSSLIYQYPCALEDIRLTGADVYMNVRAYFKTNCLNISELKMRRERFSMELNAILMDIELVKIY
ncbi:hypothetical protein PAEPH01_0600, partial [Pancytospora epiphaga]